MLQDIEVIATGEWSKARKILIKIKKQNLYEYDKWQWKPILKLLSFVIW